MRFNTAIETDEAILWGENSRAATKGPRVPFHVALIGLAAK